MSYSASLRPLDEENADRFCLAGKRQSSLLVEMFEHQRLVMILSVHPRGKRASDVREPGDRLLGRNCAFAHHRASDETSDMLDEPRIISRGACGRVLHKFLR